MSANFQPTPTEVKLEQKLELYRGIHAEFYQHKERVQYLGQWLFRLSGEIQLLRNDLRDETKETPDGQLKLVDVPHGEGAYED